MLYPPLKPSSPPYQSATDSSSDSNGPSLSLHQRHGNAVVLSNRGGGDDGGGDDADYSRHF